MNTTYKKKEQQMPVAIIGMSCFFPKSQGLKEYWRLLYHGIDAITDIPKSHWSPEDYFDADPTKPDYINAQRGGFLSPINFDPSEFGIPPSSLEATDSSQLFGLVAAKMALRDAGYCGNRRFNREKTSVILGVTGTQELVIPLGARLGHPYWRKALADSDIPSDKSEEIIKRISDSYVSWQESSFPGLLGNVVAGRISNRLDLGGTNCVVDAACASSLSAVHLSMMELISGHSDMVITGGVDTLNDIFMHMCFSKTQLLSPTGDVRPFSKDADGTLLGEGVGILVLKRLSDAEKDGDRIYAVIKALGSSSDGKSQSIYSPRKEGQVKALQMAYQASDVAPRTVELVEAHGTGTRVGDQTEFQTLKHLFLPLEDHADAVPSTCSIGSVKSMIGHTKAAAGSAGIIKSALALYNKVLPPTLKAENPDPKLDIENSPFYLNTQSRPWVSNEQHPRRCGVSSFGFGGSNFHAVLEEYNPGKENISWNGSIEITALNGNTKKDLLQHLTQWRQAIDKGITPLEIAQKAASSREIFHVDAPLRLLMAIDLSTQAPEALSNQFDNAINAVEENKEQNTWQAQGTFFGTGETPGKLAFIFPGQGSQYVDMGRDLVCNFPQSLNTLEKTNTYFKGPDRLSDYIYPIPTRNKKEKQIQEGRLRQTDVAQPAIGALSIGMLRILSYFGLYPDTTCGHSYGELPALYAAGRIDLEDLIFLSVSRGRFMAEVGKNANQDRGTMLAVKAPLDKLDNLVNASDTDCILANRNSPNQGTVSGSTEGIARVEKQCKAHKFRTVRLPVAAAFHSRLVKSARKPFIKALADVTFKTAGTPVFSNTTGVPYPNNAEDSKKQLADQILCPVDFVSNIENIYKMGARTFIEVGPKTVLTGLVRSILKGREHHAMSMDGSAGKKFGILDLAEILCRLAALGYPVKLNKWEPPGQSAAAKKPIMNIPIHGANYRNTRTNNKNNTSKAKNKMPDITPPKKNKTKTDRIEDNISRETIKAEHSVPHENHTSHSPVSPTQNHNRKNTPFVTETLSVVQEGLKSIQALQMQTTQAHNLFLTTQTETNRTLQKMMENAQRLAETALGHTPLAPIDKNRRKDTTPQPESIQDISEIIPTPEPENGIFNQISDRISDQISEQVSGSILSHKIIQNSLLDVVSELTGYPLEMLNLDMDIEADLGIDSIKRVEILSNLEDKLPTLNSVSPEVMGKLKTLNQIVHHLSAQDISKTSDMSPSVSEKKVEDYHPERDAPKATITDIENALIAVVSELTGYPLEMLNLDMDIETDLGIDSIKRVEILSNLEESNPDLPSVSPEILGSLKTMRHIAQHLSGNETGGHLTGDAVMLPSQITPETSAAVEPTQKMETPEPIPENGTDQISRHIVTVEEKPWAVGPPLHLPKGAGVLITEDHTGLAAAIRDALKTHGITGVIIPADEPNPTAETDTLGGLIIIPDSDTEFTTEGLKAGFLLAKHCGPKLCASAAKSGAFLASITRLDGAFGFRGKAIKNPLQGALAGLVKTAAIEWDKVLCRAIDLEPRLENHPDIAEKIVRDLLNGDPGGPVEVGYHTMCSPEKRFIPVTKPAVFPDGDIDLQGGDVVIISGGARGVTASAALALAGHVEKLNLFLLGRSPTPFSEPRWLVPLQGKAEIKKAIITHEFSGNNVSLQKIESAFNKYMANREISNHLKKLEKTGAHAVYHSTDCRDIDSVKGVIQTIRSTYGPIKAIIHGAGVIADRLINDKTAEQFNQVVTTKIIGGLNLLAATRSDPLKYIILFSSVAARMGNKGQVDYVMANEGLNKIARQESLARPDCKVISINWGPWQGGMVSDSLKREFSKRKIDLISLKSGGLCMLREMMGVKREPVEVVIGSDIHFETALTTVNKTSSDKETFHPPVNPDPLFLTFKSDVDLDRYPIMESHVIDGIPVVPFALMAEWFGHSALHANPGLVLQGFDDMRLLKGIRLRGGKKVIRLMAGKPGKIGSTYHVNLEIRNGVPDADPDGKKIVHTRAKAILADTLPPPPVFDKATYIRSKPYMRTMDDVYEKILFHGAGLRGINKIISYTDQAVVAEISPAPLPEYWMAEPMRSTWISDPLVLDSAFQMASLWCYESRGMVSLPSYSASYRQYCRRFPNECITVVLRVKNITRHKMVGDFTFLSSDDTVIARITGYEAIMDAALFKAFHPQSAA